MIFIFSFGFIVILIAFPIAFQSFGDFIYDTFFSKLDKEIIKTLNDIEDDFKKISELESKRKELEAKISKFV